ncbi:MAG: fimbrillin family protein [Rikenellaceae bacterium]
MKRYRYILLALSFIALSCQGDLDDIVDLVGDQEITFNAAIVDMTSTKGEPVSSSDFDSFGVYAWTSGGASTLYNINVTKDSYGYWSYENTRMWSLDTSLRFYGYAPYTAAADYGMSVNATSSSISVDYTIPTDAADQPDLMLGVSNGYVYESAVTMTFKHALAAVDLKLKGFSTDVKVTSIEVLGDLAVSGTASISNSGIVSWSNVETSGAASFFLGVDPDAQPNPNVESSVITDDGYLMMIPYSYDDNTIHMILTFEENGATETLAFAFSGGITWSAGYQYSYIIEREVRTIYLDYTDDVDSNCYMLHPYNGVTQEIHIPISSRINDFWNNYATENQIDFSTITAESTLTADVLWHDTNMSDLVDDIYDAGFTVECVTSGYSNANCAQALKVTLPDGLSDGNILVAVRDENGNILWSWHFWITDYNPDSTPDLLASLYGGGSYVYIVLNGYVHKYDGDLWSGDYANSYIMGRNIGDWETTGSYTERRGMLYQFGRKDPFMYDFQPTVEAGSASFATSVLNPTTFYTTSDAGIDADWCSQGLSGSYLWNDKNVTASSGKSIFDPSPLGWRMPIYGTWSAVSSSNISNYYYRPGTTAVDYIQYPISGYYERESGVFGANAYTYVWSATSHSAFIMGATSTVTATLYRSYGYSVRPIRDI